MYQPSASSGLPALHVIAAGCSDIGRVRTQNEDAIALCEPPDQTLLDQLGRLYLLADGAGGHAAGEVASRVAVETIAAAYYDLAVSSDLEQENVQLQQSVQAPYNVPDTLALPYRHIKQSFLAAHAGIRKLALLRPEYAGMVTTCIAAVIKGNELLIAHVGDSRAYLIRPSPVSVPAITRLTTDHSMVTELARAGIIPPEHVPSSPSRHILLRALGEDKALEPEIDITTCIVQAKDYLVLCCDGLWSTLSQEQIAAVVLRDTPEHACQELIRLANEAGGEDNISAVVLSFEAPRKATGRGG